MKQKTIIILWAIAAVLALAVFSVNASKNKEAKVLTEKNAGDALFDHFPANDIAEVVIEGAGNTTTLKKEGDDWRVAERELYQANVPAVNVLLRGINDMEITQSIYAQPEYSKRFGFSLNDEDPENHGIHMQFKDASGGVLRELLIGKAPFTQKFEGGQTEDMGRYVKVSKDSSDVYVLKENFPGLTDDPAVWLNSQFIRVTKPVSIAVAAPANNDFTAWEIRRGNARDTFSLAEGGSLKPLKEEASTPFNTFFNAVKFADVLRKGEAAMDKPEARQITIKTGEDFTYVINIAPGVEPTNFEMSFKVSAEFIEQRVPEADETEDQKKNRDDAYKAGLEFAKQRLEREQKLQGWVYKIAATDFQAIQQTKDSLVASLISQPIAPAPQIEAVTEPVQIGQ